MVVNQPKTIGINLANDQRKKVSKYLMETGKF